MFGQNKRKTIDLGDQKSKSERFGKFVKNDFVERKSLLDEVNDDSAMSKSPFRGILRLVLIVGLVYALNALVKSRQNAQSWSDLNVFRIYSKEILTTFAHWTGYILYSHLSLMTQKLILSGLI